MNWRYWTRIVGAWVLLRFASAVVKDAEKLLRESSTTKPEVVDAEVVSP